MNKPNKNIGGKLAMAIEYALDTTDVPPEATDCEKLGVLISRLQAVYLAECPILATQPPTEAT